MLGSAWPMDFKLVLQAIPEATNISLFIGLTPGAVFSTLYHLSNLQMVPNNIEFLFLAGISNLV
jgi:hypothetical protein